MMKDRNRKVLVLTNADCIRRKLDAELLRRYFLSNGYAGARSPKDADLILLVTCSYKKSKEDECIDYIHRLGDHGAELIVAGCLPEIAPERLKETFKGRFISTRTIHDIDKLFPHFDVKLADLPDTHFPAPLSPFTYSIPSQYHPRGGIMNQGLLKDLGLLAWKAKERFKLKPKAGRETFLRVGYGCVGGCAYCAINRAVGRLRSKPLGQCSKEYRELLEEGYRFIVIVSDNIGAYGMDCGSSLPELLDGLSNMDRGIPVKWDIRQIAPKYLIRYKDGLLKYVGEKKIANILCPAQSGSPRILERMNRDPDMEGFKKALLEFHEVHPGLTLKTEVIIGFPSETEEDFQETLNLFKEVRFSQVSLFAYSDVRGTPAAELPDKIDRGTMMERIERAKSLLKGLGVDTLCDEE